MKEYYTFVENKDASYQGIGLTEKAGKYQGVVYQYGEMKFGDEHDDGTIDLTFNWEMLDSNGLPKEAFQEDFFNLIGDILVDIVEQSIKDGEINYADNNRENDSIPTDL